MATKTAQAEIIGWHERAKEEASKNAPDGFRLWEICPTDKYARNVAKRYNFKGFLIRPDSLDGEAFFALYTPR